MLQALDTLSERIKDLDERLRDLPNAGSASLSDRPRDSQIFSQDNALFEDDLKFSGLHRGVDGRRLSQESIASLNESEAGAGSRVSDTNTENSNNLSNMRKGLEDERKPIMTTGQPETSDAMNEDSQQEPITRSYRFMLELDIPEFLNEQHYDKDDKSILERIIVFSTSHGQITALTSGEYLRSMWPATADHLLSLLTRVTPLENGGW